MSMTMEQAIKILKSDLAIQKEFKALPDHIEALEMAIQFIEQQPCTDCISRQAAMDCFKKWQPYMSTRLWDFEQELSKLPSVKQESKTEKVIKMRDATPEEIELLDKYIKSISKPTVVDFWDLEQEPCGDAISRQAVLDAFWKLNVELRPGTIDAILNMINGMPPVNPQQKIGHWIVETGDRETGYGGCTMCSECSGEGYTEMDYCPNCGAKMIEPQESEEV